MNDMTARLALERVSNIQAAHKRAQADYSKSYNRDHMNKVIAEYLALEIPPTNLTKWCEEEGRMVPVTTFKRRIAQEDPFFHPKPGRPAHLQEDEMDAVVDACLALDIRNNGKDTAPIIRMMVKAFPKLSYAQASNVWHRDIKNRRNNVLERGGAEGSTKARITSITEDRQRFYHTLVDDVRAATQRMSKQSDPDFDEAEYERLLSHFVGNLDEEGVMAFEGNVQKVVGRRGKPKVIGSKDNRTSITTVHWGTPEAVGSSAYLLAGKKKEMPRLYHGTFGSSEWLQKIGAPAGSKVFLNDSAFMTDETWDSLVLWLVERIRSLPVVKDHPLWWFTLYLDGFGSHVMTQYAQDLLYAARIAVVKENSDSSQTNQVFDDVVAAAHKSQHRMWLPVARELNPTGVIKDQVQRQPAVVCCPLLVLVYHSST